jgi:DNA-binding response OmpR family regulator
VTLAIALVGRGRILGEMIRSPLVAAGHSVTLFESADGVENVLSVQAPRVILVARRVGAADGLDVLDRLRNTDTLRGAALVLVSPDEADRAPAAALGATHLRVPFGQTELLETVGAVSRGKKMVLLADDSALIHRHTVPILQEAGYEVVQAYDGGQALTLADERQPDLCITDVEMPVHDGYEVCRGLKQRPRPIPVIICSSLGEAHDLERGFDAGADDYLVKPAQAEELVSRVRDLLSSAGIEHGQRERVLIADDSPAIRHLIADALTRQGFAVTTAIDGADALEKAHAQRFDMLITDYDMPRMTGFELVHAWRRDPSLRDLPTMMLTARNTRRDQAQMRAAGLTTYLVKPFSVDKCVAMVERLLAERRLRAYKEASRLYISEGAVRAAEAVAAQHDASHIRADERQVAVLFSDICGFTAMSQKMAPRDVVELLNGIFDRLCPALKDEGGDIDKFIGDAIMAVFEEQTDSECAALRAVRAALEMQKRMVEIAAEQARPLQIRVGVNVGMVVRGDIGSRHVRRDYTVIGDVVNRAQRFESMAPKGGVLVGENTYNMTRDKIEYEIVRGLQLKGIDKPIDGWVAKRVLP